MASLANFALVFKIVSKETNNAISGILASALFISTYAISGSWFDIARMDSLFLTFFLLGIYFARFHFSLKGSILAALFFTLSILTKQTALPMVAFICFGALIQHRTKALLMCFTVLILVGGSTLIGHYQTDGWYTFHVLTVPASHVWREEFYMRFWTRDMFVSFPIALVLAIAWITNELFRGEKSRSVFYLMMAIGMFATAWVGRLHSGGFLNVLIPAYLALSIMSGLAFATFQKSKASTNIAIVFLVTILIGFQFWSLKYDIQRHIPTETDKSAWEEFVLSVAEIEGEVYIPYHSYIGSLAGKKSYAHKMALGDVMRVDSTLNKELSEELQEEYRRKRFSAVILDAGWETSVLKVNYKNIGVVFTSPNDGFPVTGLRTRPRYFFIQNKKPWDL